MKKLILLLIVCLCGFVAPASNAQISINIGDRPYYSHGPGYWSGRYYYVWAPGHWRWRNGHKYWVHGHYRVR